MSSKSKNKRPRSSGEPPAAKRITNAAPAVETALTELVRRNVRASVWLVIRLVGLSVLMAVSVKASPLLAANRAWLEPVIGLLVTLPFFTALGRNYAWRIALGRAYVREERWADAERTLGVFTGPRATLFDAAGEGRYHLALAKRALGQTEAAETLLEEVAEQGRPAWKEKARQAAGR